MNGQIVVPRGRQTERIGSGELVARQVEAGESLEDRLVDCVEEQAGDDRRGRCTGPPAFTIEMNLGILLFALSILVVVTIAATGLVGFSGLPRVYLSPVVAGAEALAEPLQSVSPFAGESTAWRINAMSSALETMRGRPMRGRGGSSGWIHILTPTSSAVGITSRRKRARFSRSDSASMSR